MNLVIKLLIIVLLLSVTSCTAQIKNSSFEIEHETIPNTPADWSVRHPTGILARLVNDTAQEGEKSLMLTINEDAPVKNVTFSQVVPIESKGYKKYVISFYMKAENFEGNSSIWCQVWSDDAQIGFVNGQMQNTHVTASSDWKKHQIEITVNPKAVKFVMGGYFRGTGTVWFDQIELQEIKTAKTPPAKEVTDYLTSLEKIVKENAIYADKLNWDEIHEELAFLSLGIDSINQIGSPKEFILSQLRLKGDNHSFMQTKQVAQAFSSGQMSTSEPKSKLLDNNIGYISVPEFGSRNMEANVAFATKIQGMIKELDTKNDIKAWVVDLRPNGGGNMHPMIAGLGPLYGNSENMGYFINKASGYKGKWFYKDGSFGVDGNATATVQDPYVLKNANPKIAVLFGAGTGSSGEMTAVTFLGRPNTKSFGQVSGGYTTTNSDFDLPNGDKIYLASGFVADRTGKEYPVNLTPEVVVEVSEGDVDGVLEQAVVWLLGE